MDVLCTQSKASDYLLIFFTAFILFLTGLSSELIGSQARYGLFAMEMLHHGPTFFPTLYQSPYPDYPGTSVFVIYLISRLMGNVSVLTAVLPTAAVSAFILVVIYHVGALRSRQWGLSATLLALFTELFFAMSQSISLDQYTSLAAVSCFYIIYSASVKGVSKRLWYLPFLLVAGFAFRGPIGLIIPAVVICSYYIWDRNFRAFFFWGFAACILLALCVAVLLGAAYLEGGKALVRQAVLAQAAGRIGGSRQSIAFYWIKSFASCFPTYPLALFVIGSRLKMIIRRENEDYRLLGYLSLWAVAVMAGMSVPGVKKMHYLLPVVPALSLISSYMLIDPAEEGVLYRIRKIFLGFCIYSPFVAAGLALAVMPIIKAGIFPGDGDVNTAYLMKAAPVFAAVMIVLGIFLRKRRDYFGASARSLVILATGVVTFIAIGKIVVDPLIYRMERTRPFVEKVEALREKRALPLVFFQLGPDREDVKFAVNLNGPLRMQFVRDPLVLPAYRDKAYFIAKELNFQRLPPEIARDAVPLLRGKIGHEKCIVFRIRPRPNE